MAYYRTCPRCGANLDPGEKCDCGRKKERINSYITENRNTGQYTFCLEKGVKINIPVKRQKNAQ